ncbi:MAG: hypothetical protein E7376_03715 [Clostridiales bacterium]|nr:hypothetical protein [Clostridiales bacterium]
MDYTNENSNLLNSDLFKEIQNGKNSEYIIEKYVLHNIPFYFKDNMDLYFDIKKKISEKYNVPITNIYLVGSGQFGFSLNPDKNYSNFRKEDGDEKNIKASDLDFAIISTKLFDEIWDNVCDFRVNNIACSYKEKQEFSMFRKYLFKGWIRPDAFPFQFSKKKEWFEFFNSLNNLVNRQVSCGIFRNESSFIKIYQHGIDELILRTKEINNEN